MQARTDRERRLPGGRRQGRPRSARAQDAVLQAAGRLLVERGAAATSVDAVAAEAGVSKATIYRWWASKEELLVDAVDRMRGELDESPVSDDPRADLVAALRAGLRRFYSSEGGGRLFPRLLDAAVDNPELAEAWRRRLISPRRKALAGVLQRGIERGDLRADFDMELAVDLLVAPFVYRLHVTGAPTPEDLAEELVAVVWSGLAAKPDVGARAGRS